MAAQKTYCIDSEKLAWRVIDGEVVILNLDSGYYYRLDPVGTQIWQMLEKKKRQGEIIKNLAKQYSQPESRIQKDFDSLVKDFKKEGLIKN
ncbi:MAG: PqqD family protein [Candidatus Omnitrophota bacterium]|nr:PqqD family protein [Candidatus Omnitrophota bacterium]